MEWSFEEGRPIYIQIVEQMKLCIASKAYAPGEKLPSVRELAVEAGVNPNTMQRALAQLERDGLLHSVRTSGRFITEEVSVLSNLQKTLSRDFIKDLFDNLKKLGMTETEIIKAVEEWRREEQ